MADTTTALSAGAISARIDRLPPTRTVWAAILLLSAGMFFELYDLLFTAYIAPSLVQSGVLAPASSNFLGLNGVAGFIAALFTGLFIGTFVCGFLADRFGRQKVFVGSLIWYTLANIMVALQNDAFGLDMWRLISGIGLGVEIITIGTYLSEMAPKHLRGKAFACSQTIGFACVPIASFLAYVLVPTAPLGLAGWRWVVLIGVVAAALIAFLRLGLPESPRWLARQGRLEEADRVLSAIEERVQREYGAPLPPPGPEEPISPATGFSDLWTPTTRGRVILMSVFNIFQTVGFYGFQNWVPTLLVSQGLGITKSLGYTTVIALAAPIGPLLGFFLGDRVERKFVIVVAAGAHSRLRPDLRRDARGRRRHCDGRRPDARQQHHVLQLPCLSAGAVPDRHPRPGGGLRLFLEPAVGDFLLLRHRLPAQPLRRSRRVRLHRRRDDRGDGDDRVLRAADEQRGVGADFAVRRESE